MDEFVQGKAPEFVRDPDVLMSDDERRYYVEAVRPAADAGNAMAVIAVRAMKGMEGIGNLLVDYTVIVDQAGHLAIDTQREMFLMGASWYATQGGDVAWTESDEARARAAFEDDLPTDERAEHARRVAALRMAMAYSRMVVAVAILVDRHRLAPDELEAVERAFKVEGITADHEGEVAEEACKMFVERLRDKGLSLADTSDLVDYDDARVKAALLAAVREVREGTEARLTNALSAHEARAEAAS